MSSVLVSGYEDEIKEDDIQNAIGGNPSSFHSRSCTVATFNNIQLATEALKSLRESGLGGKFSVQYAREGEDASDKEFGVYLSRLTSVSFMRPLYIIWDWENCPIPNQWEVDAGLYEAVVKFLGTKNFYVSGFAGYGSRAHFNKDKFSFLEQKETKIDMIHVDTSKDKDAADQAVKVALLQYLCDRLPPCPILLMSGDKDFTKIIYSLRKRGFQVYLAYNNEAQGELIASATEAWHYFDVFGIERKLVIGQPKIRPKRKIPDDDEKEKKPKRKKPCQLRKDARRRARRDLEKSGEGQEGKKEGEGQEGERVKRKRAGEGQEGEQEKRKRAGEGQEGEGGAQEKEKEKKNKKKKNKKNA